MTKRELILSVALLLTVAAVLIISGYPAPAATGDTTAVGPSFGFGVLSGAGGKVTSTRPKDRAILEGVSSVRIQTIPGSKKVRIIGTGGGHTIQNAQGVNLAQQTIFQCYSGLDCENVGGKTRARVPKLNSYLDAKADCGAVADCSTDDTVVLQTCLNSMTTVKELFFPSTATCYKITDQLTIPHNNIHITGAGVSSKIQQFTNFKSGFVAVDKSNISIRSVYLYGTGGGKQLEGSWGTGIIYEGCNSCEVASNKIENWGKYNSTTTDVGVGGVWLRENCTNSSVFNNFITECNNGINEDAYLATTIVAGPSANSITQNTLYRNRVHILTDNITADSEYAEAAIITNNVMRGHHSDLIGVEKAGVKVAFAANQTVANNKIQDCNVGIVVVDVEDAQISNNIIEDVENQGIFLWETGGLVSTNIALTNNQISGIEIAHADNWIGSARAGVLINAPAAKVSIDGIDVVNPGVSNGFDYGIYKTAANLLRIGGVSNYRSMRVSDTYPTNQVATFGWGNSPTWSNLYRSFSLTGGEAEYPQVTFNQFGAAGFPAFASYKARGTSSNPTQTLDGDYLFNFTGYSRDTDGWSDASVTFGMLAVGDQTNSNWGSKIRFVTTTQNTTTPAISATLHDSGVLELHKNGSGIKFPDGTTQTTAASAPSGNGLQLTKVTSGTIYIESTDSIIEVTTAGAVVNVGTVNKQAVIISNTSAGNITLQTSGVSPFPALNGSPVTLAAGKFVVLGEDPNNANTWRVVLTGSNGGSTITASDKQLIFSDGANNPTGAASLYWDKTTAKFGHGISTPSSALHIYGTSDANIRARREATTASGGAGIFLQHNNASNGLPSAGDRLGFIVLGGLDGATDRNAAAIQAFADTAWGAGTESSAYLRFETTPDNSTTRTERLRITSDGALRIAGSTSTEPTCDSTRRGDTWYFKGGAGVADTLKYCIKNAADAYEWKALY